MYISADLDIKLALASPGQLAWLASFPPSLDRVGPVRRLRGCCAAWRATSGDAFEGK